MPARCAAQPQLRKLAIVPAYNEEGWSAASCARSAARRPTSTSSSSTTAPTDATAAEAEASGAVVLRHPFNLGIGGAVQSGFKYALRHGYDVAAQVDGDGQHKPAHLHDLLGRSTPPATRPTWSTAPASAATPATRCRSAAGSAT